MTDLVAFLEARLVEDQRRAKLAVPFKVAWSEMIRHVGFRVGIAEFITVWDPARVLAEIAAKRAIVQDYVAVTSQSANGTARDIRDAVASAFADGVYQAAWLAARRVAATYADHEEFDPSWRVDVGQ